MTVKNKYVIRSRVSVREFREIIRYFSLDLNAVQVKQLTELSGQTNKRYLLSISVRILSASPLQSAPLAGQIEVDERYFGAFQTWS